MTLYFFHGDENTVVSFMDKSNSGIKVSGALLSDNDCTAWYHINGTLGNCHWREHICTDQWAYDVNLYVVLIYVFSHSGSPWSQRPRICGQPLVQP
jgi:hypothetical protein